MRMNLNHDQHIDDIMNTSLPKVPPFIQEFIHKPHCLVLAANQPFFFIPYIKNLYYFN